MESFSNPLLQHIISTNGNDKCVECGEANPKWVSFPSSVFVCGKCARLHKSFTKPQRILSVEVAQFTDHEIKLLSLGGNNRFISLMSEYSVSLTEPSIEYKYLTVIGYYHSSIIEAEVNKLEGKEGAIEKYKELLSSRPIYEIGGEIHSETSIKDEAEAPANNEHEEVKSDVGKVASTLGGWFGYLGNAMQSTAKYVGIDKTITNAKNSISNTITSYGVDTFVKNTSSTVYQAAKGAGGFIVEKGKEVVNIPIVKGTVDKVEHGYVAIKERATEIIGSTISSIKEPLGSQSSNESNKNNKNDIDENKGSIVEQLKDDSLKM